MPIQNFINGKYTAVTKFYVTGICLIIVGIWVINSEYGVFKKEEFTVLKEQIHTSVIYRKSVYRKGNSSKASIAFLTNNHWFVTFYSEQRDFVEQNKNVIPNEVLPGDTVSFTIFKKDLEGIKDHSPIMAQFYSFATKSKSYLNFDINEFNTEINDSDKKMGSVFIVIGIIFNTLGYRKQLKIKKSIPIL